MLSETKEVVSSILSQASKDPKIFRYILDEANNRGYLNPPKTNK